MSATLIGVLAQRRPGGVATIGPNPTGAEVAARAWRIYGLKGAGNVSYRTLGLRHTVGGANQTGTPIRSTDFSATFDAPKAFDVDPNSRWAASGNFRQWLGLDFGPGQSMVLRQVLLEHALAQSAERITAGLVEWSNDLTTWTPYALLTDLFANVANLIPAADQTITVTPNLNLAPIVPGGTPRRYHEVFFWGSSPNPTFLGCEQVQFRDSAGQDLFVLHGGTPSASSQQGSFPAAAAFGSNTNYWATASTPNASWLRLDYGAGNARAMNGFSITPRDGLDANGFVVRASDDLTNWETYLRVRDIDFANGETRTYTF